MHRLSTVATRTASRSAFRPFTNTAAIMGVTKTMTKEGSGAIPQKGDTVSMEYTGYLKDTTKPDNKGKQYVVF
jgi:FK506-binding protein 1